MDEELNARFDQVLCEIAETRKDLRAEMADMGKGLRGEMAEMRDDLRGEMAETRRVLALEIINTGQSFTERIDGVEQKIDSFRDETQANFDEVYRRLERLESEYYAISAALIRVEKMISEEPSDREELKREVEDLKSRLAALEKKLADLERDLRDDHDA